MVNVLTKGKNENNGTNDDGFFHETTEEHNERISKENEFKKSMEDELEKLRERLTRVSNEFY